MYCRGTMMYFAMLKLSLLVLSCLTPLCSKSGGTGVGLVQASSPQSSSNCPLKQIRACERFQGVNVGGALLPRTCCTRRPGVIHSILDIAVSKAHACVDLTSSPGYCGSCTNSCGLKFTCSKGKCVRLPPTLPPPSPPPPIRHPPPGTASCHEDRECRPNQSCCSNLCSDTSTDSANCNFCGNVCPANSSCINSACVESCTSSSGCSDVHSACCDGKTCLNLLLDVNNCGGCGHVCQTLNLDSPSYCSSGMCQGECEQDSDCPADGSKCCNTGCVPSTVTVC